MKTYRSMVLVSSDPISMQRGAQDVFDLLKAQIKVYGLEDEISLAMIGDAGRHDALPLVIVYPEAVIYGPITVDDVSVLVEEHLYKGRIATDLQASNRELSGKIAWLNTRKGTLPAEQRIVLRRAGIIDPTNIEDYILHDGYQSLGKVLSEMTPAQVIDEIKKSGLARTRWCGFPDRYKMGICRQGKSCQEIRHL